MKQILIGTAVLALLSGCEEKPSVTSASPSIYTTNLRTDTAPIMRRLPDLGSLQSVWWHASEITTDSFLSPPSHPAYRVWGLAQLEKAKAKEISDGYKWQKMPAAWRPDIMITNIGLNLADWNQSAAFTKDCKPALFPGEFFFERSNGVVYFDFEVE